MTYTVTYADTNFSAGTLAPGDITLNKTGTANATIGVTGTGTTRTVTLSSITGDGALGISIAAGTASDLAGNTAPAAGPSATFTADNTPPTVTIGAPSASLTRNGPVTYAITYADTNFSTSTLTPGDITLNRTGTANATVGVTGAGATRTVTLSSITGDGALGISLAAGTASDLAGNAAPVVGPSASFTVDNTAPTLTAVSVASSNASRAQAKEGDEITDRLHGQRGDPSACGHDRRARRGGASGRREQRLDDLRHRRVGRPAGSGLVLDCLPGFGQQRRLDRDREHGWQQRDHRYGRARGAERAGAGRGFGYGGGRG